MNYSLLQSKELDLKTSTNGFPSSNHYKVKGEVYIQAGNLTHQRLSPVLVA